MNRLNRRAALACVLAVMLVLCAQPQAWGEGEDDGANVVQPTFSDGTENYLSITDAAVPSGKPGAEVTVAIPISFDLYYDPVNAPVVNVSLHTNTVNSGGSLKRVAYSPSNSVSGYAQDITKWIDSLKLSIDTSSLDALPFAVASTSPSCYVIRRITQDNYKEMGLTKSGDQFKASTGEKYNLNDPFSTGFAVFKDLKLKSSLTNGYYAFTLKARWTDVYGGLHNEELNAQVRVTGASSGGGGGGGSTEKASPTAKLIVDTITTEPLEPKAGDVFDIILLLRNTSEKQYLQNITLTYSAEEDAVLPINGAASVYIDRIPANSDYEQRLRVKAQPDISDKPIKLEVSMDFEDKAVSAHTATQTLILNIKQPQRVKVDEPVMPATAPYEGESAEITVAVYNLGKPTLYNVAASIVVGDENLMTGQTFYVGNMENGTSKTCELELIPMKAGDYEATVHITYEDANGNEAAIDKPVTLTAVAEMDSAADWSEIDEEPVIYENIPPTTMEILQLLPWWLYAAVGGLFLLIVVALGVSARKRRRKALEDDEAD